MKLIEINNTSFNKMLRIHKDNGGNNINNYLSKLFEFMNDETNWYEVSIKVAALNQLYATAIQNIIPVVNTIVSKIPASHKSYSEQEYSQLVDRIATVEWTNKNTKKKFSRYNLSFASKYIHFLSKCSIPIYDSYIWIVLNGYMAQHGDSKYAFTAPKSYKEFYRTFLNFKHTFKLDNRSNYDIDKFLWQYGKNMLEKISKQNKITLEQAKSLLKKSITIHST